MSTRVKLRSAELRDWAWSKVSDGAAQPLVVVKDLGRRGGERNGNQWLVRHVSFTLHQGKVLAIEGPTGAGKSVLLRA